MSQQIYQDLMKIIEDDLQVFLITPAELNLKGEMISYLDKRDESQQLVGQAYSSAYNTLYPIKSSTKDMKRQ